MVARLEARCFWISRRSRLRLPRLPRDIITRGSEGAGVERGRKKEKGKARLARADIEKIEARNLLPFPVSLPDRRCCEYDLSESPEDAGRLPKSPPRKAFPVQRAVPSRPYDPIVLEFSSSFLLYFDQDLGRASGRFPGFQRDDSPDRGHARLNFESAGAVKR